MSSGKVVDKSMESLWVQVCARFYLFDVAK